MIDDGIFFFLNYVQQLVRDIIRYNSNRHENTKNVEKKN